ncbi:MAG: NIPSNAP family protein, partial [Verrucomicrobiota bacterium]
KLSKRLQHLMDHHAVPNIRMQTSWVPRDMEIYRDKVTGIEHLFLLLGNPGITTGVYDPDQPGRIRWSRHMEFPFLTEGSFTMRPLGLAEANGKLYFSQGDKIYRRNDGERPSYSEILDLSADTDTDVGGIRGLTAIRNPTGSGQSLIFVWAPGDRSASQIKRLDPDGQDGFTLHDEVRIIDLMSETLGVRVTYTLAGHNMFYSFNDPKTGGPVHLIGFQGNIQDKRHLRWTGSSLYGGAMYAIRYPDSAYRVHEVNNRYAMGKSVLVSPRAFCSSPFGDNDIFVAGHDSSRKISDNLAWIFKAPAEVVLGASRAKDAKPSNNNPPPEPRLTETPLYELRIYTAKEGRFQHVIKRFRNHTDRIFKKRHLESIGYWIPTEGTAKKKRRFIYILKHASRYEAYRNWVHFNNDREWEAVLDTPEFRGPLAEKPISIFMTANDYSHAAKDVIEKPGGVFELRTYTAAPGRLSKLNDRFRHHTTRLFNQHGMKNVGYWTPFDTPDSSDTLIYLIHHESREQADENWKQFLADPEWKKVAAESRVDGRLLAEKPERIFLKALDFSPLK